MHVTSALSHGIPKHSHERCSHGSEAGKRGSSIPRKVHTPNIKSYPGGGQGEKVADTPSGGGAGGRPIARPRRRGGPTPKGGVVFGVQEAQKGRRLGVAGRRFLVRGGGVGEKVPR